MALAALLTGALVGAASAAQPAYPSKPITFVVWSSAGSPLDVFMRRLAALTEQELRQTVIVVNRTGGSGAVAMAYVQSQPADGYTILSTTGSFTFTLATGQVPFRLEDFVLLKSFQAEPSAVAVRKDSRFRTLDDFVAYMRQHPRGLRIGGFATAGFHQYVLYRLQTEAGFEATWIPFEGGADALIALLGGHIDVAVLTPSTALSQVQSGEVRLLGISTERRSPYFPDVPTFKEQGYDVVEYLWRGVMVKRGTPAEVLQVLNAAFDRVARRPEWNEYMTTFVQEELLLGTNELEALARRELHERRAFLRSIGVVR